MAAAGTAGQAARDPANRAVERGGEAAVTGAQATTQTIRVPLATYDKLAKLRQEFYDEHTVMLTFAEVIERLLADRKPVRP